MADPERGEQFWNQVLPQESAEIERRKRAALGRDELDEADRQLVGLSLSGGGIRSATFCLGVIQSLARNGLLRFVDYLSTVSGGGFIGASLSSLLNQEGLTPGEFAFARRSGAREPVALVHLRNSGNYLAPGGLLDTLRLPTLFLRGALINFLLVLPWVMLAVQLTEILYEFEVLEWLGRWGPALAVALFLLLVVLYPLTTRFFGDRFNWAARNRLELLLTASLLVTLLVLLILPFSLLVGAARDLSVEDLKYTLTASFSSVGAGPWKWLGIIAVSILIMLAAPASTRMGRMGSKLLLYLIGLVGPLVIVALFFVLCVIEIDSPYLVDTPQLARVEAADPAARLEGVTTFAELEFPELDQALREHGVRVSGGASITVLEPGSRWRLADLRQGRIFLLRRVGSHQLVVHEDLATEVASGFFSQELKDQLAAKGVTIEAPKMVMVGGQAKFPQQVHQVTSSQLTPAAVAALRRREITGGLRDELLGLGIEAGEGARIEGHAEDPLEIQLTVVDDQGQLSYATEPLVLPVEEARWTIVSDVVRDVQGEPYAVVQEGGRLKVANFEHEVLGDAADPFFFSAWAVFLLFSLLVDINQTSWHGFYRDRLSRSYLVQTTRPIGRVPVDGLSELEPGPLSDAWRERLAYGGVELSKHTKARRDSRDDWLLVDGQRQFVAHYQEEEEEEAEQIGRVRVLAVYQKLAFNDRQKLSELNQGQAVAPYHLINASLNLTGSGDPNLRGRNADFFLFSKLFTGGPRTGYCETERLEEVDRHLNLGTAMAVSGAAASPNMGTTTVKALVFIMTMLNIRLGYWLPHPRALDRGGPLVRMIQRFGVGVFHLLREGLGMVNAQGAFVNLSDGGHIENLGIYELLRRRCRVILAIDAEEDAAMGFGSLIQLIRFAAIDLGIEIDLDVGPLRPDPGRGGRSAAHCVVGKIHYGGVGGGEVGYLVYVKATLTGDERDYVLAYAEGSPFPHESTAKQFFSEKQFEAYRELGSHIGNQLANELGIDAPPEEMAELLARVRAAAERPPDGPTTTSEVA